MLQPTAAPTLTKYAVQAVKRHEKSPQQLCLAPLIQDKVSNNNKLVEMRPLYADPDSWLNHAEISTSARFTRFSKDARVFRADQDKVYLRMLGQSSSLGKVM